MADDPLVQRLVSACSDKGPSVALEAARVVEWARAHNVADRVIDECVGAMAGVQHSSSPARRPRALLPRLLRAGQFHGLGLPDVTWADLR